MMTGSALHTFQQKDAPSYHRIEPDKSIAQLPRTSPNLGWASDFLFHLPRKLYRIYKEYCNSKLFSRCCGLPGKWLKLEFVRPCNNTTYRSRVKIYITLVFDLIEVSTLLRSVQSINDSSIPILVVHWRNSRLVPPYKSFILTRWSPAFSRNVIAVVVASPEENTIPVFKRNQCTFKGSNSVKICYISLLKRDLF